MLCVFVVKSTHWASSSTQDYACRFSDRFQPFPFRRFLTQTISDFALVPFLSPQFSACEGGQGSIIVIPFVSMPRLIPLAPVLPVAFPTPSCNSPPVPVKLEVG